MLDRMRYLCNGKSETITELCKAFNKETSDGKYMKGLSKLLENAIRYIIKVKEESDIDTLLCGGQISFLLNEIKVLGDFELICFFVIKELPKPISQKKECKLVIVESLNFHDYPMLVQAMADHLKEKIKNREIIIVSRTAKGADQLGEHMPQKDNFT